MIDIIHENDTIFEVSNGIIGLKFYKMGENKGKYEIKFKNDEFSECIIKDCYSVINFISDNKESLKEIASLNFSFKNRVEKIDSLLGKGLKIIFETINKSNLAISFKIQFKFYERKDFFLIKLIDIKDNSQNQLPVHSISPLTIKNSSLWLSGTNSPTKLNKISWFKQGWQSWSPCKILKGYEIDDEGPTVDVFKRTFDNQDYKIKGRFYSEYCTVITDLLSKNSLVLGFITLASQFTRLVLDYEKENSVRLLTAFGCTDGIRFKNSSIDFSEELYLCFKNGNLGYYGLIDYAKLVKYRNNVNLIENIPIGWCSWYYYFTNITQEEMIKNLEFFKENRDMPIDFIQLDDGYFTFIGDFNNINSKFSNGLKSLFNRINDFGFKSGIWTAPFFAEKKANIYKQHRDWFLKDYRTKKMLKVHYGMSWNVHLYGLDLSNPQVLEYLHNFYRNLLFANELNQNSSKSIISFFKIDFLHAAVPIEGDFFNKDLTRAQVLHNGVKTIKNAITNNTFLLACGAPLGPCVGVVDAMRIGEDTDPRWEETNKQLIESGIHTPSLKVSLINIIYRSFMHRNFWINDPDCLMIRRKNTQLNIDEIRLQLTIMGLSGGQILISDDMTKLSEEEINDAKLLIPPYNPKDILPIPVDAFISDLPSIFMLETNEMIGKRYLVAIINWDNNIVSKPLKISDIIPSSSSDESDFYAYDFWNEKYLGEFKATDAIEVRKVRPHSCVYLNLIPVNKNSRETPLLLSSNLHISQGCCEIRNFEYNSNLNQLSINLELKGMREGFLLLKLPQNKKIVHSNFKFSSSGSKENLWKVFVQFKDSLSLNLKLD